MEKVQKTIKTRCYYTDYVNHMIRFYLSTPDGISLQEKKYSSASIENWIAVQTVFHRLEDTDKELVKGVHACGHYLPKAVDAYCQKTGANADDVWRVLTRVNAKIARVRDLV